MFLWPRRSLNKTFFALSFPQRLTHTRTHTHPHTHTHTHAHKHTHDRSPTGINYVGPSLDPHDDDAAPECAPEAALRPDHAAGGAGGGGACPEEDGVGGGGGAGATIAASLERTKSMTE